MLEKPSSRLCRTFQGLQYNKKVEQFFRFHGMHNLIELNLSS